MHLVSINVYPVKGMRGVTVPARRVEPWGLAGDRLWMAIDARGRFLTQREVPLMAVIRAEADDAGLRLGAPGHSDLAVRVPDSRAHQIDVSVWKDRVSAAHGGDTADLWLSTVLGAETRLVYMTDPGAARPVDPTYAAPEDRVSFADGFPLLITTRSSLDDLSGRMQVPLPMDRFRPNLVVDGAEPWAEDHWRRIRVGAAVFVVPKPCARCAVTTVDQATGLKSEDREPLRTLQTFRRDAKGQVLFGQNLIPIECGPVRIGDPVEVLDWF